MSLEIGKTGAIPLLHHLIIQLQMGSRGFTVSNQATIHALEQDIVSRLARFFPTRRQYEFPSGSATLRATEIVALITTPVLKEMTRPAPAITSLFKTPLSSSARLAKFYLRSINLWNLPIRF